MLNTFIQYSTAGKSAAEHRAEIEAGELGKSYIAKYGESPFAVLDTPIVWTPAGRRGPARGEYAQGLGDSRTAFTSEANYVGWRKAELLGLVRSYGSGAARRRVPQVPCCRRLSANCEVLPGGAIVEHVGRQARMYMDRDAYNHAHRR